jgi:nucleotide-binding universal stress UspA family protein
VIAVDGSETAADALAYGLAFAREQHADVVLVHVDPAVKAVSQPGTGIKGFDPLRPIPHTLAEDHPLQAAAATARATGLEPVLELRSGDPAHEIEAAAAAANADLIVVGSRGLGAVGATLKGSVSHALLHTADRPVLVAHGVKVPVA